MTACKGKKTNFYLEGCWAYLYKRTCLFRTKTRKSLDFAETVGRCVHISDAVKRTFHLQHVIQFSYSHNLLVLMAMKLMAKFSSKAEVSLQLPSTWRRPSYTCQYQRFEKLHQGASETLFRLNAETELKTIFSTQSTYSIWSVMQIIYYLHSKLMEPSCNCLGAREGGVVVVVVVMWWFFGS